MNQGKIMLEAGSVVLGDRVGLGGSPWTSKLRSVDEGVGHVGWALI